LRRADLELGEDLAQVIFDGARADEQAGADLWVRESVAGQPRDLGFLRGQLVVGLDSALAHGLARGQQLPAGSLGERLRPHRGKQVVGGAQLHARVHAPALAAQPFAVDQTPPGQLHPHAGAAQALDRLAIETLGGGALAEQGADTRSIPSAQ